MRKILFFGLASLLALPAAQAQVTYVDATVAGMAGTANTTGPTGNVAAATAWQVRGLNGGPAADVTNFSNAGSALQYATNPIDASNPTLTTTITGLSAAATYQVFALFWDDVHAGTPAAWVTPTNASAWDLAAKLSTDASYQQFDSTSGFVVTNAAGLVGGDGTAGGTGFDPTTAGYSVLRNGVDITGLSLATPAQAPDSFATNAIDGNRAMFAGLLSSTVTGVTTFSVNIQASANTAGRSWYDGVGFREVAAIPEPGSLALLGFASVAGLIRRRR